MRKVLGTALLFACGGLQIAQAIPLSITVEGTLFFGPGNPTVFGITEAGGPVQISFDVESDAMTEVAAGTIIDSATGLGFADPVQVASRSAISNLNATIGTATFPLTSFIETPLGDLGPSYAFMMVGPLTEGPISSFSFMLDDGWIGMVNFGQLACFAVNCTVTNFGGVLDHYADFGFVTDITATLRMDGRPVGVPEPGTLGIMSAGLLLTFAIRRGRHTAAS